MRKKRSSGNSIPRLFFVCLSVLFQVGWLLFLILKLNNYSTYIYLFTSVLAFFVVLRLYSRHTSAAMKMPWIMLILALPVMGLSLYLMIEIFGDLGKTGKRLRSIQKSTRASLPENQPVLEKLGRNNVSAANISRYLLRYAYAPVYERTRTRYFSEAAEAFEAMKEDLRRAQKSIFLEYFIVEDSEAFWQIREILTERSAAGVDVRILYDDIGSIGYANFRFAWELEKRGIRCRIFNPAVPVLNLFMNHRDHRKIAVIDGIVGYTGGYNLANEYFDISRPYGKWKDTGIRLEGDGVRSMTASFLEMWHVGAIQERVEQIACQEAEPRDLSDGFVQPYCDSPLEKERVAENVYLNLIGSARESLWFMTPYLIVSDEMISALGLAAKRGVDVRIITPGIPDKKAVFR